MLHTSSDPDRRRSLHKVELWVLGLQLDPDLFGGDLDSLLAFVAPPLLGARALPLGAAPLLSEALDILLVLPFRQVVDCCKN